MLDSMILSVALATGVTDSRQAPKADVAFLKCVIRHESGSTKNPARAENPYSTASGWFQFVDGTWRFYNRLTKGVKQYAHAAHAPTKVQWAVALTAVKRGDHYHWKGTNCGYGT